MTRVVRRARAGVEVDATLVLIRVRRVLLHVDQRPSVRDDVLEKAECLRLANVPFCGVTEQGGGGRKREEKWWRVRIGEGGVEWCAQHAKG